MTGRVELDKPTILPCGCVITPVLENDVPTLIMAPCRMDCEYLEYTLDAIGKRETKIEYRKAP